MKHFEEYLGCIIHFIIIALLLWGVVFSVISCVAETRMNIEVIKSGNVPVEVHNEK
jgi:hypothetical protein